jgi:hypothetical protein
LAQNIRVEQGVSRKAAAGLPPCHALGGEQAAAAGSGPVDRFTLAIGALPMLETARIGGEVWSSLGV